jgi:hypothetical protein
LQFVSGSKASGLKIPDKESTLKVYSLRIRKFILIFMTNSKDPDPLKLDKGPEILSFA